MRRRAGRILAAGALALAAACAADQDPEIAPPTDGPVTTSRALPACPADGPDPSTTPAGCVAEDGTVQRP